MYNSVQGEFRVNSDATEARKKKLTRGGFALMFSRKWLRLVVTRFISFSCQRDRRKLRRERKNITRKIKRGISRYHFY